MNELSNKQKINLAKVLMDTLNTGDWKELFSFADCTDCPQNNSKFYQDAHWHNEGLKQGCILAVEYILDQDPVNIKEIWEIDGVQNALKRMQPELFNVIESTINGVALVPSPNITNTN